MRPEKTLLLLCGLIGGLSLPAAGAAPAARCASQDGGDESGQDDEAPRWFEEGRDALFRGEPERAVELLEKAVAASEPGTRTLYRLHLARALRYAGRPENAEALLVEILEDSPDHVEAGQMLGELLHAQERWQRLFEVLEPLLKYRHDYPTHHLLAEAAYNLDDFGKARGHYQEAIRLNPSSATDHYQLANIFLAQNRFALAALSFERALQLGAESAVLHYKLASAYFNLRNYFGRVSEVTVPSGRPGTISGEWYLIEPVPGQEDVFRVAPRRSAIFQTATAIAQGLEDRPDIQMLLANIHLNARRFETAYEMYARLGPTVPDEDRGLYHYYFAQSAFGLGRYDEYVAQLREAIERDPEAYRSALVDAFLAVADKHNQAGDLEHYIEYLELAVRESPQTASLHLRLGHAYAEARQSAKAVEQWRMVLDLEPDHPSRTDLLNSIQKHGGSAGSP